MTSSARARQYKHRAAGPCPTCKNSISHQGRRQTAARLARVLVRGGAAAWHSFPCRCGTAR
eukprot:3533019-Prymnesium_polylepis.1